MKVSSIVARYALPVHKTYFADKAMEGFPTYLTICDTSRLFLPALGEGNDARFAEIFRQTWQRIPLRCRRRMVKHWRDADPIHLQGLWSPTVQLVNDWRLSDRVCRTARDMGVCGRIGHSLYFYAPIVDAMPPNIVQDLIAHELAHCYLYAIGDEETMAGSDRTVHRWLDNVEIYADEAMEVWGFSADSIDEWEKDNKWVWDSDPLTS